MIKRTNQLLGRDGSRAGWRDAVRAGVTFGCGAAAATLLASSLTGCGEEPPPPPPPPPVAAKPVVEPPKVTSISELMAKLGSDTRIRWPEERAPVTINDAERTAILNFFDAFARGDSSRLQPMLSATDQYELDNLVKSGAWDATTKKITRIDIRTGKSPASGGTAAKPCVLAVYQVGDNFEPQLWSYRVQPTGAEFEAVATPPGIMNQLSGEDWVTAWFELLQKDEELANKPDENPHVPQSSLVVNDNSDSQETSSAPSGPSAPAPAGAPSGPSPSKRPPGPPIKAPRPGFGSN
ncbi:MAG: hypothetical protein U0572_03860 [Phycisphaerales bacterium]